MHLFIKNNLIEERLKSKREPTRKVGKNAVSIILTGFMGEESIVWHIQKICKNGSVFLTLPHSSMEAEVAGKRVNHECGYWLEIPVRYHFLGPAKTID